MGSSLASPLRICAIGILRAAENGEFLRIVSTEARNRSNGFIGAVLYFLCGRLCETSIANEAPIFFVIIRREKAHHRRVRSTDSFIFEMEPARAANCRRLVASNQKRMKAFVSLSAPTGYASLTCSFLYIFSASFNTFSADLRRCLGLMSEAQVLAMSNASGSVSKPIARCPRSLAATAVVPDPTMGSRTRSVPFLPLKRRRAIDGAIRAGNGWIGVIVVIDLDIVFLKFRVEIPLFLPQDIPELQSLSMP